MADSAQDKTEKPTGKRLGEARKKGQVPRSKELTTFLAMFSFVLVILIMGPVLGRRAVEFLAKNLTISRELAFDSQIIVKHFAADIATALLWILPFLLVSAVAAVVASVALGGLIFSGDALKADLKRMNPVSGLKRMVSLNSLVEMGKGLVKFVLIGAIMYSLLNNWRDLVLGLGRLAAPVGIVQGLQLILGLVAALSLGLALIAAIDVPFQKYKYIKDLKMTKQEVKDEARQMQGSPEVKGRIRNLQYQMAFKRTAEAVPKADVVITNPTHFAVAIKYSPDAMRAPTVIAKGADEMARLIRDLADANDIPKVSAPRLARSLYRFVDVDQEIPVGLFEAVAQVLSYVYALRRNDNPAPPVDPDVPEGLRWAPGPEAGAGGAVPRGPLG